MSEGLRPAVGKGSSQSLSAGLLNPYYLGLVLVIDGTVRPHWAPLAGKALFHMMRRFGVDVWGNNISFSMFIFFSSLSRFMYLKNNHHERAFDFLLS